MKNEQYQWQTYDGINVFAQSWQPDSGKPKAVINLVHGLGEHCGRYAGWAIGFTEAGHAFLSMDLRGHGKSGGKRGHTPDYLSLMRDIDLLLVKSEELFPGVPVILYGHSMGGNLVINYAIRFKPGIFALIATSPWLMLTKEPSGLTKAFAGLMKVFFPSMLIPNGLNAEYISRDPEAVRLYLQDPLVHNKISFTTFFAIMHAGLDAMHSVYLIKVPFLLMHGSGDQITSPKASQEFIQRTHQKATFKLWNDCYHELQNEPEKKEVFAFILGWLGEVLAEANPKESQHGYF